VLISLDIQQSFETTVDRLVRSFDEISQRELAKNIKYSEEECETLEISAKELASLDTWGAYSNAAEYLWCAASITAGVSLLTLGPNPYAILLISSGVLGMGKRLVADTIGWEAVVGCLVESAEEQKRIATEIEWGLTAVEMGTALAGGIGAAGASLDTAKGVVQGIQYVSAAAGMTTQLGTSYTEWKHSSTQETLKRLNAFIEMCRIRVSDQASQAKMWGETSIELEEAILNVISAVEVHN
jgi:hypothetical protein